MYFFLYFKKYKHKVKSIKVKHYKVKTIKSISPTLCPEHLFSEANTISGFSFLPEVIYAYVIICVVLVSPSFSPLKCQGIIYSVSPCFFHTTV